MLHGTKDGVTRDSFAAAIAAGTAADQLRAVPARVGDLLRIPPGTLHAVGKGCVLLEVQEPSDTTFRVFDYNRVDATGKPRALHVEQALAVARFGEQPPTHVRAPIEAARFSLALYELDAQNAPELAAADPFVVHALTGNVVVEDHTGARSLPRGATCIVPPHVRVVLQSDASAHVAVMSPR
jgi:mannose-6-phosphate isomerase